MVFVAAAPVLAAAALVTHILWATDVAPNSAAGVTPVAAAAALLASAFAVLVARSRRPFVALAVASFIAGSITLVLWWDAMWTIAESS